MMRLVTNERAMPGFLALTLQSRASRAQIEGAARGTSESMVKLTAHTIAQLRIPLPCWDEQNEIFIAHQDIYRRLWNERRLRGKYERLRDGLMDDLFRGVVRA
jgi:type I restriction enzyme S subunit